jgi:ammonium transporter Rh
MAASEAHPEIHAERQGLVGARDVGRDPAVVEMEEQKVGQKKNRDNLGRHIEPKGHDPTFVAMAIALEIVFIVLFAIGGEYRRESEPYSNYYNTGNNNFFNASDYSLFVDIHTMMLLGFGFLMAFLRRYSFGSVAFTFLLCAICIQWQLIMYGLICQGWNGSPAGEHLGWGHNVHKYSLSLWSLVEADFGTVAVLVSLGAVLGRTSPSQLLMMAFIEIPLYCINFYIVLHYLDITDTGGTITIFVFGCFFGLAASMILGRPRDITDNKSMYHSDMFAMIGTLLMWVYWPSFNAYRAFYPVNPQPHHHGLIRDSDRTRCYVNTVLALCASTVAAFMLSKMLRRGKFEMMHIQNATLAGGVAIGICADLYTHPAGAIGIGFVAGLISTIGYAFMQMKMGMYDTCGVLNLYGLPGILGAIASAITVGSYTNRGRFDRSLHRQAGFQIAGLVVTLGIALVGGAITGVLMKLLPSPVFLYSDADDFIVPGVAVADFFRGTIRGRKDHLHAADRKDPVHVVDEGRRPKA